jgi:hypothetical protein
MMTAPLPSVVGNARWQQLVLAAAHAGMSAGQVRSLVNDEHSPQSASQLVQLSLSWQVPSPHTHAPQSAAHDAQSSSALHAPSPHTHAPQSLAHVSQLSVGSQVPLPHEPHAPQSAAQLVQSSVDSQLPLPHAAAQAPQSSGQSLQSSVRSHAKSPHTIGHAPQSPGQLRQSSPVSHDPLPHTQTPQSAGQLEQLSDGWQTVLPHGLPLIAYAGCGGSGTITTVAGAANSSMTIARQRRIERAMRRDPGVIMCTSSGCDAGNRNRVRGTCDWNRPAIQARATATTCVQV